MARAERSRSASNARVAYSVSRIGMVQVPEGGSAPKNRPTIERETLSIIRIFDSLP
jgi:hypothetical protein